MGKEQELVQAVKAEDVGTAQRLLQRPRPGKASECGGRAGRGRGPHRLGVGRGRDAVGLPGWGGARSAQTLGPRPPSLLAPALEEGRQRASDCPPSPLQAPAAPTVPEAAGDHILPRIPSLSRLRADDFYLCF